MVEELKHAVEIAGQKHAEQVDVHEAWRSHLARTGSTRRRGSTIRVALIAASVVAVVAGVGVGVSLVTPKPVTTTAAAAPECPSHYDVHGATGGSETQLTSSDQAAGLQLCGYVSALNANNRLSFSTTLDAQLATEIATALQAGQHMGKTRPLIYCPIDSGVAYQMIFTYPDRTTGTVMYEATGCRYAYTDQLYTIGTDRLAELVSHAVGAQPSVPESSARPTG